MHVSTDEMRVGALTATLLYTWIVMAVLLLAAWLAMRHPSRAVQTLLETLVAEVRDQIAEIGVRPAQPFVPFVGTLFLFISASSLLSLVPGLHAPTASLSTTAALACCVFAAVPFYGVRRAGLRQYLKHYVQPTVLLLPFHVVAELSRTLALAVRLFGNMMSGGMAAAVMLAVAPFFFPIPLQLLEVVIGQIQAYIFAVLAMVYIASALSEGGAHE